MKLKVKIRRLTGARATPYRLFARLERHHGNGEVDVQGGWFGNDRKELEARVLRFAGMNAARAA